MIPTRVLYVLEWTGDQRKLRSFPTRRSSDLDARGGDGGNASADGGDGGKAFNFAYVKQSNGSKDERKDCGCHDKGRGYDKGHDDRKDCGCEDKGRSYDKGHDKRKDCGCKDKGRSYDKGHDKRKDCGCKDKGRSYDKGHDKRKDCGCKDRGYDKEKSQHSGGGSNSVHQGDNYANGGDGGIAEGGDG